MQTLVLRYSEKNTIYINPFKYIYRRAGIEVSKFYRSIGSAYKSAAVQGPLT